LGQFAQLWHLFNSHHRFILPRKNQNIWGDVAPKYWDSPDSLYLFIDFWSYCMGIAQNPWD
jgi:hypothetical protein